jgi:hypothetical protein
MLIKNSTILNEKFLTYFAGLMNFKMPAKQCLEVSACLEDLTAQHLIVVRARRAIVDKYCSKTPEGVPVNKDGNIIFDSPELERKCMDELLEIGEEEIAVALSEKIKISETELMTPLQVKLLKDFLEIVETT